MPGWTSSSRGSGGSPARAAWSAALRAGRARPQLWPPGLDVLGAAGRKQAAKRYYGVREGQFRSYVREAQGSLDTLTGDRLLQLLELRLDNALVRLGFAGTRAQARQFVVHAHVHVNGLRCDIPSRRLREGDVVGLRHDSSVRPAARRASGLIDRVPAWLLADQEALVGRVVRAPLRDEIQVPVEEQLIVEFYSRV